jgi:hypothetical protein
MKRILFALLLLAVTANATDRVVFNDAEPREGWPYPSGTKVVVTQDSLVQVVSQYDVTSDARYHWANGANTAFATVADWDNAQNAVCAFTMFAYYDTAYVCLQSSGRIISNAYKFYGGAKVIYDTLQRTPAAQNDSASFGFTYFNTSGTAMVGIHRTNLYQTTTYNYRVVTLADGELGTATEWANGDTIRTAATSQWKFMAAPLDGGLVFYDQEANAFSLIEKDGTVTKRCLASAFGQRKYASTAIAGTNAPVFYDMSITPVDPDGQGDTAIVIMCDSTTNAVKAYLLWADTANNDIFIVDSATLSGTGERSGILDSSGWRTPTVTMAGTGAIAYYRDWADTTDLATVRIAYHVATNWADFDTWGSVQYLSTDSAGAGGTIGAIMAPQSAVAYADTDSVYAYVVWNRWDAAMNIYATYTPIPIPGGAGGVTPSTARLILGAVKMGKVDLASN